MLTCKGGKHFQALHIFLPVFILYQTHSIGKSLLATVWKLPHFEIVLKFGDCGSSEGS